MLEVLLEGSHEGTLLLGGLEASVTELGGGVDELQLDLLQGSTAGVDDQRLAQNQGTLLRTSAATLDHDEVVLDNTIMMEATHGSDGLGGKIELSAGAAGISAVGNAVDLLVHLSAVVETVLTSTRNGEHDTGWMPSTNTSDLAETLVSLARKLAGTPTSGNTLESLTTSNTDDINVLVLLDNGGDIDFLLEVAVSPVDLVSDGSTVQLDLKKVSLLLTSARAAGEGVSKDTDNGAVLLDALELGSDFLATFSAVLLGVLGEGLALRAGPVLVEAATDVIGHVLSPDGGDGAKTTGSLDVTNQTNNDHGRSFDDGDSLNDFLLVHLRSRAIHIANDVSHTSLEADEGSQVDGLLGVILGEGLDATKLTGSALAGEETQGTVSGGFEFTMRLH